MIELRSYQRDAKAGLYDALRQHRSVVWVMPTGAGKRICAVDVCLDGLRKGRRILVVTNRRLLVDQMARECRGQDIHYGVIMADYYEGDPGGPLQIASLQSLFAWYLKKDRITGQLDRVGGLPRADLVIIDEGHQDTKRYTQLLAHYADAKVAVLTATPVGAKGRSLTPDTYETLVEGVKNTALVAAGWLLPTRVFAPSEPNMQGVEVQGGQEFNQSQLSRNVEECTCFADVLREWTPFADRKTVAFVPGIKFGRDLERLFNEHLGSGKAHLIHAKTRQAERDRILQHVAEGDGQVLISVDILKEGFDLPELSCGIDLQPNHQLRSYWQKVGRTKRPFGDQTNAVWLDFAGNYWRFPHPNDDPTWPEGDETTQEVIERERAEGKGNQPISCPACHEVYTPCGKPVCPHCGHEIQGTPVRRIRMGDGRLIEVPAMTKRKVEKTDEQRLQDQWKSALIGGIKANRTFGQCAYLYRQSTGKSPQQSWPGVFERGSLHWKRKVHQDLNLRELLRRFEEIRQ